MQWYQVVGFIWVFIILGFIVVGSMTLQRDKYWLRIWYNYDKPKVKSIKELKAYVNEESRPIDAGDYDD